MGFDILRYSDRAREEERPDSDMDILVEFEPDARVTVFNYVGIRDYIADLFSEHVDVIDIESLKPYIRAATGGEAVYAF